MKTIRDILDDKMFPSGEVVKKSTGKVDPLMTQALVKIRNDNIDQALKELKEVILGSLPNKRHYNDNEIVGIFCDGYNQALEDTRKAIKSIIGGK